MLLFFFPAHSETSLKTAVAVSVTATLKHVGVVVIVKVVAAVLEKSYTFKAHCKIWGSDVEFGSFTSLP